MRSAPTLFVRLRLYRPRPGRDAAEDRLTGSLAATLEGAPDVTRYLVQEWFEPLALDQHGPLHVSAAARDLAYRPTWPVERGIPDYVAWLHDHELLGGAR